MPCDFPFYVDNPAFKTGRSQNRQVPVPCGKCPDCCARRSNGWQFRLLQQEKEHRTAHFITLTYDTKTVPISKRGFMTLKKKDFQDFMKRLRKLHPKHVKIKYYAVGEYGSTTYRPHYHAIIYDMDKELLSKAWTQGISHVGDVSGASVAYTCKYMHKGKIIPQHKNDDRVPEFSLMSKKMGANYMTPQVIEYHQADITRNYVVLEGGVKIAMPRYYREKIYSEEQRQLQGKEIEKITENLMANTEADYRRRSGDYSPSGYERANFESKKQKLTNFRNRAKDSRTAI